MLLEEARLIFVALGLWSVLASAQEFLQYRSVWVEQGLIKGRLWKFGNRSAQVFRGIPYAEPPIGNLRFKRPVKKAEWRGERLAMEEGPPCLQFMPFHIHDHFSKENMRRQSEDCLYLNIFSPWSEGDEGRRYPIVVWVHGGSFLAGSGDTTIDREATIRGLVFKGVMVVTVNYRLGPLGFLVHRREDGSWDGNAGLWDLVEVLRWISKNARQFNGDSGSVTLMGESAGGAAVSLLSLSPVTQDLIHGAIVMSGSGSAGWAVYGGGEARPAWSVPNVAAYLRCEKSFNRDELKQVLAEFGLEEEAGVCNLYQEPFKCDYAYTDDDLLACMQSQLNFTHPPFRKMLTVELGHTKTIVDGELIPDTVENLLKNYSRVPLLTGAARDEWAHKKASFYQIKGYQRWNESAIREKFTRLALEKWKQSQSKALPNTTYQLVANSSFHRYVQATSHNQTRDTLELVDILRDLEADLEFHAPLMREVEGYAQNGGSVWLYSFEHTPSQPLVEDDRKTLDLFGQKHSVSFTRKIRFRDAFHGLDHAYLFTKGIGVNFQFNFTRRERRMANLIQTLFTNFIKYQDPTPRDVKGLIWPAYSTANPSYLRLRLPPTVKGGSGPKWEAVGFWNSWVNYLAKFAEVEDLSAGRYSPLTDRERIELGAYKRAWWALWLLVGCIALLLWCFVLCLVAKKCLSASPDKPLNHLILTTNR